MNPSIDRASQGRWYRHGSVCLVLVAATCLVYRGALGLGFFYLDDALYVTSNPWIRGFSAENVRYVLTTPYAFNYSPIHLFSYALDWEIAGDNPRAYHWSSNLWAAFVACWVYILGLLVLAPSGLSPFPTPKRTTTFGARVQDLLSQRDTELFALIGALLFVVHPAHVEAVAWISSRKDLVAAAFALPAMAAYLLYRRHRSKKYYAASLLLFVLAAAGKLSVVVVPGILFVFDLVWERRHVRSAVLDKLPFVLIAVFFALRVMGAQPATRQSPDAFTVGFTSLTNLWLLTGLGEYVLYRARPDAEVGALFKATCVFAAAALPIAPLLFSRRIPGMILGLFYWVLLALIPPQVLSFLHPVSDRYLFFPSAGFVLLLAWLALRAARASGGRWRLVVPLLLGVVAVIWGRATLAYLAEWQDPRSVWHAASSKSEDPQVFQYLGTHYHDHADRLPELLQIRGVQQTAAIALAREVWRGDDRLRPLIDEWELARLGPLTAAYRRHLLDLAMQAYDEAVSRLGAEVVPSLYFRRGRLLMEMGQHDDARQELVRSLAHARMHTARSVREEMVVRSLYLLAVLEAQVENYDRALQCITEADREQSLSGKTWIRDLQGDRAMLEDRIRSP